MKKICSSIVLVTAALFFLSPGGCATNSPSVKNMIGAYSDTVAAPPDKTLAAARKAVEAMKLTEVTETSTKVDGRVAARTAQGEVVSITVSQISENESNVTVRVGTGDEAVATEIIRRIKSGL